MPSLKTNTAVMVALGPFVDATDGVTPETALTVANTAITVIAETDDNSAPTLVLDSVAGDDATNTLAHITGDGAGFYSYKLTAANLNRLGRLHVCAIGAAHAPCTMTYEIKPANEYDSAVLGTDVKQVDVTQISNSNVSTTTAQLGVNVVSSGTAAGVTAIKKNTAKSAVMIYMELTAGGPATGKTVTVEISKDGGAFASIAGAVTEVSDGFYKFNLTSTELNADVVAIIANATACNQAAFTVFTQV